MKLMKFAFAFWVGLSLAMGSSIAEGLFDKFEEADKAAASDVERFRQVLNSEDPGRRMRAMRYMLASKNAQLIKEAKDFGLFSTDKTLQSAALRAIFDQGGPFRLVVDITKVPEEKSGIIRYLSGYGAGFNAERTRMYFTFRVSEYDQKAGCWKSFGGRNCALYLVGTFVSLRDWSGGAGSLELNDAGQLVGSIRSTNRSGLLSVPAGISLVD